MCLTLSKNFARSIALFCCAFFLLALPLSAKASWTGLLSKTETTTNSSMEESVDWAKASQEEFLQGISTTVSKKGEIKASSNLLPLVEALKGKLSESQNSTDKLLAYAVTLNEQLEDLKANNKISDEEYEEIKRVCEELATNVDERGDVIVTQQKQIVKLNKDIKQYTGIRPYIGTGATMQFSDGKPVFGANVDLGAKLGKHLLVTTGVGYIFDNNVTGVDKLNVRAGAGWIF